MSDRPTPTRIAPPSLRLPREPISGARVGRLLDLLAAANRNPKGRSDG